MFQVALDMVRPRFFIRYLRSTVADNRQTIVTTAVPRITDEFHSLDQVGWYGSAFFLTLASFQSTWGKLYKYFALKFVFLVSVMVFELGSLVCGG